MAEPIQLIMRIATVYKYRIRRWKGVFRVLIIKEASNYGEDKNKP